MSTAAIIGYVYDGEDGWHYVDQEAENHDQPFFSFGRKMYQTRCGKLSVSNPEQAMHSYNSVCPICGA